jgi:hypothetical protein
VAGGLTACYWVVCRLAPVALDRFFGRDPVGRSSSKGCSRSVRSPRTSQATAGMKRERNLGLKERIRAKEIKMKSNDKILVDAIEIASIDRETFII